jgi:hypothetical protein
MRPIEIFYHLYIPDDNRAGQWTMLLNQHMKLIKDSHLNNLANVNIGITMPKHWTHMWGIPYRTNQDKTVEITFSQKVQEYINTRYPWVNILDIRDTGDSNIYEGQTLKLIYEKCCHGGDFDVLYFHSKGAVSSSSSVICWREILDYYCITQWTKCLKLLQNFGVVGVKDAKTEDIIMSGNFWWSKSEYIKTLSDPLQSNEYMGDRSEYYPNKPAYRYAFERWILSNNPSIGYMVDTKTDHYDHYCFLEDLKND